MSHNLHTARWAFFGTPEFAKIILEKMIGAGIVPSVVVCNSDKPVGRKKIVTPCVVKKSVLEQEESIREQITLFEPERLSIAIADFPKDEYDFFLIAAYGQIIPESILQIPKYGTVGVHPSLLPKYRGASPIQTAILDGVEKTGTTFFLIDKKVDHGPILAQHTLDDKVDAMSYHALHDIIAYESANLVLKALPQYLKETLIPTPQDHTQATFTKKFVTQDGFVSEELLHNAETGKEDATLRVDRMVRALSEEPGVWTIRDGIRTKILETIIKDGKLKLVRIQEAGKTPRVLL